MPEPDQRFGKYVLVRRLAVGGMAEIFLAEHRGEAGFVRPVVIKRVLPGLSEDPEFVSMFLDEARLLARLIHPNVVHVYDFGRIEDTYFLALEYVRGGNLRELFGRLKGAPLPVGHALYIAGQILAGLDHAHRARAPGGAPLRLVHRDISPSNMLLSVDGAVKLADFGIARSTLQRVHTAAFVIKGKLSYMSPEQVTGRPLDARSDLFSTGVLLWEMITGRRLFARESPGDIQHALCVEPIPSARDYRREVPDAVLELLARALQRDRAARFPSAAAMQAAIDECLMTCRLVVGAQQLASFVRQCFPELVDEGGPPADDSTARVSLAGTMHTALLNEPEEPEPTPAIGRDLPAPAPQGAERSGPVRATAAGQTATTPLVLRRPVPAEPAAPAPAPRAPSAPTRAWRAAVGAVRRRGLLQPIPLAAVAGAVFALGLVAWMMLPGAHAPRPAAAPRDGGGAARAVRGRDAGPPPRPLPRVAAAPAPEGGEAPRANGREAVGRPADPAQRPVEHGFVSVQSRPSAVVSLDGRNIGETPVYRRRTTAGGHTLELRAAGFPVLKRRIQVPARGEFQKTFDLAAP